VKGFDDVSKYKPKYFFGLITIMAISWLNAEQIAAERVKFYCILKLSNGQATRTTLYTFVIFI